MRNTLTTRSVTRSLHYIELSLLPTLKYETCSYMVTRIFAIATKEGFRTLPCIVLRRTTIVALPTTRGRNFCYRGFLPPFLLGNGAFEFNRPFQVIVEVLLGTHNFNITFIIGLFKTKSDINKLIKLNLKFQE